MCTPPMIGENPDRNLVPAVVSDAAAVGTVPDPSADGQSDVATGTVPDPGAATPSDPTLETFPESAPDADPSGERVAD